jgi:restriction endonuclease S subunit
MFYRRVEWQWPVRVMKPIATALKRKSVEVDPNADRAALPIIEKISFGGAVSVSAPRDRIGYKGRLFWANKGDYIYSKIRVKQGSSAIVPDSVEALAVSPEYPVYEVDQRTAVSGYFELVIRSRPFLRLLDGLSHGGSTKTRIPPQQFEQLVIPLPPLETQRAILAEWRKAKAEIAAAQERITKLEAENRETFLTSLGIQPESARPRLKCFVSWWRELERWSVEFVTRKRLGLGQSEAGTYPPRPLGVLCVGISGSTPSTKDLRFWNGTIPWVSPKDMKTEVVTDAQDHISEIAIEEAGAPLIEAPAVLVVMRSGILQRMVPVALLAKNASINQDLRAYRVRDTTTLMPEFLAAYLQNRQDDLLRLVKWSTTVQSMNKEELDRFPIPLPPIDVQRRIMERVEAGRARIAHEREVARETARRIEADLEAWLLGTKEVGS